MSASAPRHIVIAIDGPAASGKGTLARLIAERYSLAHLDTGLLYRAVGYFTRASGHDITDKQAAVAEAKALSLSKLTLAELRTAEAGKAASVVAAIGEVRTALLDFQRAFASTPQPGKQGAVLDGRDIGSVICPDARVKFFITATPQTRARRRYLELKAQGSALSEAAILADILERDQRDANRKDAPLMRAEGAHLLDTTDLSIEAAFAAACAIIDDQLDQSAVDER